MREGATDTLTCSNQHFCLIKTNRTDFQFPIAARGSNTVNTNDLEMCCVVTVDCLQYTLDSLV